MRGWIYIMSNPSYMSDLIKIGCSKSDPKIRLNELSKASGVPMPFELEYCVLVEDYKNVEKKIHMLLKNDRKSDKREFLIPTLEKQ